MRLINADALLEALKNKADEFYEDKKKGATFPPTIWFSGMSCAADIIRVQPTIETERKIGNWQKEYWNNTPYRYCCSNCMAHHSAMYDYCPSCGSYNGGDKDDH